MANANEMDELYEMSIRHEIRYVEIIDEYIQKYVSLKNDYAAMNEMRRIYGDVR